MGKCLNCMIDLTQTEGKRAKVFCNPKCRAAYWQKNNRKDKSKTHKLIPIEEYNALLAKVANMETYLTPKSSITDFKTGETIKNNSSEIVTINTKPPRLEGESSLDYKIRLSELGF